MRKSKAWDYFEIVDNTRKIATCNLCQHLISYNASVSNLMKHLTRKHDENIEPTDEEFEDHQTNESDEESTSNYISTESKRRSVVWKYFKSVDDVKKVAMCQLCKATITHATSTGNLKRHLRKKHPALDLSGALNESRIILSTNDGLYELVTTPKNEENPIMDHVSVGDSTSQLNYENANNGNIVTETVYLENRDDEQEYAQTTSTKRIDIPTAKKRFVSTTRPRKIKKSKPCNKRRNPSGTDSSEEESAMRRYPKRRVDSVDYFGKFLTSLLKQLPRHISNRLQGEFVKQTMNALLDQDTQPAKIRQRTSTSNGYSINVVQRPDCEVGTKETVLSNEANVNCLNTEMTVAKDNSTDCED